MQSIIIITLTKLFVIRIVANVRSLSSSNDFIFWSASVFPALTSDISEGSKLKKAISEPLAKPEMNNKKNANRSAITTPKVGDIK